MGVDYINPLWLREQFRQRTHILLSLVGVLFFLLALRFVWLQLIEHGHFSALSENNSISLVPNVPPRGVLYDRQGVVLAAADWGYALELVPETVAKSPGGLEGALAALATIVRIEPGDLRRFKRLRQDSRPFEPVTLRQRLTEEEVARFVAQRFRFPGVEVRSRDWRSYPFGATFSHLVGYIGRVSPRDKERLQEEGRWAAYRGTQYIGKAGIEKRYEAWLHGQTGFNQVEVDSSGRAVRLLGTIPPVAGYDLTLHVDAGLQQTAEAAFGEMRGALVALDPNTGGLLALLSKPGFDPNLFIDGIDQETWQSLNGSPARPLINRALRGVYPPGSTLKPFMALAGLKLGLRRPGDRFQDPGYYSLPGSNHRYRDWKKEGHGVVDLQKSIVISCDTYYYQLAVEMGIQRMHDFLINFGFGERSGIDLDGELSGLLPDPAWKERRFKRPWWPGETVIAGIGQGYVLATPMQLAVATMAIANDGLLYKPQIIKAWRDPHDGQLRQAAPEVLRQITLNPEHFRLVKEAMWQVTQPGGTASGAGAGAPYRFAGKTGTAQVKSIAQGARYSESATAAQHRDHALFIAFAPVEKPRIVVAVMVENGGHGGTTAAPIARKVLDYWLLGQVPVGGAVQVEADPDTREADETQPDVSPVQAEQTRGSEDLHAHD